MDVRQAALDQLATQQEHRDIDHVFAALDIPPGALDDLTRIANRLAELNPGLAYTENLAAGLIQGFAIGVRAAHSE
jgi:hypothetical protein